MSEQATTTPPIAPERTIQDIQNEYTSLCNKAGHINYQINTFERDLKMLYDTLRELNFEASALQAKQAAPKAEAPAATPAQETASAPQATAKQSKKTRRLTEVKKDA